MRLFLIITIIGLFLTPGLLMAQNPSTPEQYYTRTVFSLERVIDGDTLVIKDKDNLATTVRLHGIDTPERGMFYFKPANDTLKTLCENTGIRLANIGDGRYSRISANVYCNNVNVSKVLLKRGAAIISIGFLDDVSFYEMQNQAMSACKGLWTKPLSESYKAKKLTGRNSVLGRMTIRNNVDCLSFKTRLYYEVDGKRQSSPVITLKQ